MKSIEQEITEIQTKLSWMNVNSDKREEYEERLAQLKQYASGEASRTEKTPVPLSSI